MDRLEKKFDTARRFVPRPVVENGAGAKFGIIAYGSTHHAIGECRDQLRNEQRIATSYLRLRALPLSQEVEDFVREHDRIYVVEQNRDAQMRDLIRLEYPEMATKLRSVRHYNGIPIDARFVTNAILEQEKEKD
jgi:2-oxoglutarate ferredoxin oxidoreductase subunit alpha